MLNIEKMIKYTTKFFGEKTALIEINKDDDCIFTIEVGGKADQRLTVALCYGVAMMIKYQGKVDAILQETERGAYRFVTL